MRPRNNCANNHNQNSDQCGEDPQYREDLFNSSQMPPNSYPEVQQVYSLEQYSHQFNDLPMRIQDGNISSYMGDPTGRQDKIVKLYDDDSKMEDKKGKVRKIKRIRKDKQQKQKRLKKHHHKSKRTAKKYQKQGQLKKQATEQVQKQETTQKKGKDISKCHQDFFSKMAQQRNQLTANFILRMSLNSNLKIQDSNHEMSDQINQPLVQQQEKSLNLKQISKFLFQMVKSQKVIRFKNIIDILQQDLCLTIQHKKKKSNMKRRAYDVVNVLQACNIIKAQKTQKNKKKKDKLSIHPQFEDKFIKNSKTLQLYEKIKEKEMLIRRKKKERRLLQNILQNKKSKENNKLNLPIHIIQHNKSQINYLAQLNTGLQKLGKFNIGKNSIKKIQYGYQLKQLFSHKQKQPEVTPMQIVTQQFAQKLKQEQIYESQQSDNQKMINQ